MPDDRRRVLLVSFIEDSRWTGMGRWTHETADALRASGHQVETWFADDFPRTRGFGRLAVLGFPVVLAAALVRRRKAFDVVVIHEPSGFWYGLMRKLWRSLPPIVVMSHGVETKLFRDIVRYGRAGLAAVPRSTRLKAPLLRFWQTDGTLRLGSQVICLSTFDRDYLAKDLGVPPTRVTHMINGVEIPDASEPPERSPDAVLFVGTWLDRKGRRLLPAMWRRVRLEHPQARLTLVGTGASRDEVLPWFDATDRDSVSVIERIENAAEMRRQYEHHALFVLPSLGEGSPLVLLEAMSAGMACVATRVGGVPDIVTHDLDGCLFEPEDAPEGARQLVRLLGDHTTARNLGSAARERARQLTWRQTADTLLAAVNSALASG
jgi:glycosyltransferase involved in cell wall biosynthesis